MIAIYALLRNVNRNQALLMLILVALSIPIAFVSVAHEAASLAILQSPSLQTSFTDAQRCGLALFFLHLLLADGIALVAVSVTSFFAPASLEIVNRIAILPELGELAVMLRLLIKGIQPSSQETS